MEHSRSRRQKLAAGVMTVGVILIGVGTYLGMRYFSPAPTMWQFQSIDTMKYSRDLAREKMKDSSFDLVIERQIEAIANTGATHVGIATPYDQEFLPMLKRWVTAARKYQLKVWFRGNFAGWEEWFSYPQISQEEHIQMSKDFILTNKDLFEDGDVFTACPECENGGEGDPRTTGKAKEYRKFLIEEYNVTKDAFEQIGKDVATNYNSMNFDVAKLIMDKETTRAMGGIITIDHYVKTPEQLAQDVEYIANEAEGKVVLGEFGAPIPDIHGLMSDEEQAEWLEKALYLLQQSNNIVGANYWVGTGGTTQLWDGAGNARAAVTVLTKYFQKKANNYIL